MTIEQVRARVEEIRKIADDDERAHSMEDKLRDEVLKHLAAHGNELAAEVLKTSEIKFARWCA